MTSERSPRSELEGSVSSGRKAAGPQPSRRTRLRTRILLFSVLYAILLVVVAYLLTWRARESQKELTRIIHHDLKAASDLEQLVRSQNAWMQRWQETSVSEPPAALEAWASRYAQVGRLGDTEAIRSVDVGALPASVSRFESIAAESTRRWLRASTSDRVGIAEDLALKSEQISIAAIAAMRRLRAGAEQRLAILERDADGLMMMALGVTWMIAVFSIAIARIAMLKIVRPVESLSRAATEVAGNPSRDVTIPIAGDREIAMLAWDFNRMVEAIRTRDARLNELAITDALTGLPNFRAFQEKVAAEFERSARHQHSFGLLVFDLDHFKKYNDRFGHLAGNEALVAVARAIRENLRGSDFPARYGGEEFAALVIELDSDGLATTAERVRSGIEALAPIDGRTPVTCSIGGAIFPDDGADAEALFAAADQRLYEAKAGGRNRAVIPRLQPGGAARRA